MKNHIKRHFNIVEGICNVCELSFKWYHDLTKHAHSFHKHQMEMIKCEISDNLRISVAVLKDPVLPKSIAMLLD